MARHYLFTSESVTEGHPDKVCDQITVGIQPTSLVMDKYNKIWTVTDGGYEGSPYGHEAPSLYCIDAATRKIEKQFKFKFGDWPSEVQLNGTRDTLYFINKAVWRLPVTADKFPVKPFLPYNNTLYYGLTINPVNSEVYIADAIDYVQNGVVLRYSPDGELLDEFFQRPYVAAKVAEGRLRDTWREIVGPAADAETTELRLENHILHVRIRSSILRNELFYQREALGAEINRRSKIRLVNAVIIR